MANKPRLTRLHRLSAEMDLSRIEIIFPPFQPPQTKIIGRLASGRSRMDQATDVVLLTHVLTQRGKDFVDELIELCAPAGNVKDG
jgi:hypothetical protein